MLLAEKKGKNILNQSLAFAVNDKIIESYLNKILKI
jgi:hypothetical protein